MRTVTRFYRDQAESDVLCSINTYGPFLTQVQIMNFSKVNGTALKRVLGLLVANGDLEILRTCNFEGGEYAGEAKLVYATRGAAKAAGLELTRLSDGSYHLSESSSDKVFWRCDLAKSRAATNDTIAGAQTGLLRGLAVKLQASLHTSWRPDFVHSDVMPQ
jgi:hypothetical protein